MILILAGNAKQAELCATKNKLHPTFWKYIDSPNSIAGLSAENTLWLVGSFAFNMEAKSIIDDARSKNISTIWK